MKRRSHIYEKLGVKFFYDLMCKVTGEVPLSRDSNVLRTAQELLNIRRDSRYFSWANGWRAVLLIPPTIVLLQLRLWFPFAISILLSVFHLFCLILEAYRHEVALDIEASGKLAPPNSKPPAAEPLKDLNYHWYFSPKKWESELLYLRMGMERVRKIVVYYTNKTKFTPEERKAGIKASYITDRTASMLLFERDTRTGEIIHMVAGLLNVPMIVGFFMHQKTFWALWMLAILYLDFNLSVLQRYHRVRVYKAWEKMNGPVLPRKNKATSPS